MSWVAVMYIYSGFMVGEIAGTFATRAECIAFAKTSYRTACHRSRLPAWGPICTPELGAVAVLPPCRPRSETLYKTAT